MDVKVLYSNMEKAGAKIGVSTLRKYVLEGLVPEPRVRSLGRGAGKQSEYPNDAFAQTYTAWKLLNGPIRTGLPLLKEIRKVAVEFLQTSELVLDDEQIDKCEISWVDFAYLIELWLNYYYGDLENFRICQVHVEKMTATSRRVWVTKKLPRKEVKRF